LLAREDAGGVVVTRGTSDENLNNLSPSYRRNVIDRYRDSRLGRQELYAELLEDVPGALWSRRVLEDCRVTAAPELARVIVAVDPPATSGETANECGIVVVGVDAGGKAFVLDDWSAQGSPDEWARKVVAAYRLHEADTIVAEVNQGGEMVSAVIRSVLPDAPVKTVRATRGKFVRAEPVSALYEQGRVKHVGVLATLEDQMIGFTAERAAYRGDGFSPDRVDALVWGLSELFADMVAGDADEDISHPRSNWAGGWAEERSIARNARWTSRSSGPARATNALSESEGPGERFARRATAKVRWTFASDGRDPATVADDRLSRSLRGPLERRATAGLGAVW
jgi:phage terminase large subunit-like protein